MGEKNEPELAHWSRNSISVLLFILHRSGFLSLLFFVCAFLLAQAANALPETKLTATAPEASARFGFSVDVDGAYAVVGAEYEDVSGASNAGAAYVMKKTGGTWGTPFRLTAPAPVASDYFGHAVAVSGTLIAVGAHNYDGSVYANEGRVFIYKYGGSPVPSWSLEAQITSPLLRADDNFGYSVALVGNTLVVGAYGDDSGAANNSGAAYVFTRSVDFGTGDVTWSEVDKLKAEFPDIDDWFGLSVAISPNGQRILVGAPRDDDVASDAGAAYVFEDGVSGWAQTTKLTNSGVDAGDRFGNSVALSSSQALIGAYLWDGPAGTVSNQGAAYTYTYNIIAGWLTGATLTAPNAPAPGDRFGYAVSLTNDFALIGAYSHDSPATDVGSVFIWQNVALSWQFWQQINASDYASGNLGNADRFGWSVDLSGEDAIIGAFFEDPGGILDAGASYVYKLDEDGDGYIGLNDNCPIDANPGQGDIDGDLVGDACDPDIDGDTIDNGADNCPVDANPGQENLDGDLEGDVCDSDDDGDGVPDTSDNCPLTANFDQRNFDNDGLGDVCDPDDDNDGRDDVVDDFPFDPTEWIDTDGDGTGNNADTDDDDDGLPDTVETSIGTNRLLVDSDGDGVVDGQEDADGDEYDNITEHTNGSSLTDPNQTPQVGSYRFERMAPLLSQPWYFDAVAGVATNMFNGDVYLANQGTGTVLHFNRGGQLISRWGQLGGQPGEFGKILGLALGPDDVIYVADRLAAVIRIQKFSTDGDYLGNVTAPTGTPFAFNDTFTTTPLAVNSQGELYVVNTTANFVQIFDADGKYINQLGNPGLNPGEFAGLNAISVAPDDTVYTVENSISGGLIRRIQYFDASGTYQGDWSEYDPGIPPGFNPLGIAVSDNKVFVNSGGFYVHVFNRDGTFDATWDDLDGDGVAGSDGDYLLTLGLGYKGYLLVTQLAHHGLLKLSPTGALVDRWGSDGDDDGDFRRPRKIQRDSNGNLYVLDNLNASRLKKFDASLGHVSTWAGVDAFALDSRNYLYAVSGDTIRVYDTAGVLLKTLAPFDNIMYLGFDDSDRLFVLEHGTPRVWVYDAAWNNIRNYPLNNHANFLSTSAAVVDSAGRMYIQDGDLIKRYQDDGAALLPDWGGSGTIPGEFVSWIDRMLVGRDVFLGDILFVSEQDTDRVHRFQIGSSTFLDRWHSLALPGDGDTTSLPQSERPYLAAVDAQKRVYISGRRNRVRQFTEDGQLLAEIGEAGIGPGQFGTLPQNESYLHTEVAVESNDRVTVADAANNRVQAFINVPLANNPKAIVLAGGGPYAGNTLWGATQAVANTAYNALLYKGFTPDKIYYLSDDTDLKLTDGQIPVVDAAPTKATLADAITNWASDADELILYMTDHGAYDTVTATGTFRMGLAEPDRLTAGELGGWLDTLSSLNIPVTVINDSCQSGSFLSIAAPNRTIITSSAQDEKSYFTGNGALSFSSAFWGRILNGASIGEAQTFAEQSLQFTQTPQTPQLEADGNVPANDAADDAIVANAYIGTPSSANSAPDNGSVSILSPHPLNGTSTATIELITVPGSVKSVRAVVYPSNIGVVDLDKPVTIQPRFDLAETARGTGIWQGTFDGFTQQGDYRVVVYAEDRRGNISRPVETTVTVITPVSRKAIIVLGGEETDPEWAARQAAADAIYTALRAQGYDDLNDIRYYSGGNTGGAGVDNAVTLNILQSDLTSWAASDTQDLLVYFVGESDGVGYRLNPDDPGNVILTAAQLDGWLDSLMTSGLPGKLTVVMDADNAGIYLERLDLTQVTGGSNFYRLASTIEGRAHFEGGGNVSFSKFFAGYAGNGATLKYAYKLARLAMQAASNGQQQAWLDTDSDDTSDKFDDDRVSNFSLGPGFLLAGDEPTLGSAGVDGFDPAADPMNVTLWVSDITTTGSLAEVWALVTPPDTDGFGGTDPLPVKVPLPYNGTRYEVPYNLLSPLGGTYTVSFYASDTGGAVSAPLVETLTREDIYEPDDAEAQARPIIIDDLPQHHSFHKVLPSDNDEDWVTFDVTIDPPVPPAVDPTPKTITITADPVGTEADVVLHVTLPDSSVIGPIDQNVAGEHPDGAETYIFTLDTVGTYTYKVKVSLDTSQPNTPSDYTLAVTTGGGGSGTTSVAGQVRDSNGNPLLFATVKIENTVTSATNTTLSIQNGDYTLGDGPGSYILTALKSGYFMDSNGDGNPDSDLGTVVIPAQGTTIANITLTPDALPDADGDGIPDVDDPYPNNVDGDADGLCDGPNTVSGICVAGEDLNANGVVDSGETDPMNPDSDYDGFTDSEEIAAGTDPLDPLSFPATAVPGDVNGDQVVNVADVLVCTRILLGLDTTTDGTPCDVAPLDAQGNPQGDSQLNAGDIGVLQRMVLGM